jgi:ABC-2 type transport system ATP-binding protein
MTALAVVGLRKAYGDLGALDGVELDVQRGEIHAIVGLNGAGKTTLMASVVGQVELDAGQVTVLGEDRRGACASLWARVGHFIEHPFAYAELSVRENIVAAARLHAVPKNDADRAAAAWTSRFELDRWADRPARALSLGNLQRVGLACALAHDPDLLILDEPTNALDPAGVLLLRDAIVERAGSGAGVLVSSHHLDEVARIADRISVVHAGRVIGSLEPHTIDLERTFFAMVHAFDVVAGAA